MDFRGFDLKFVRVILQQNCSYVNTCIDTGHFFQLASLYCCFLVGVKSIFVTSQPDFWNQTFWGNKYLYRIDANDGREGHKRNNNVLIPTLRILIPTHRLQLCTSLNLDQAFSAFSLPQYCPFQFVIYIFTCMHHYTIKIAAFWSCIQIMCINETTFKIFIQLHSFFDY